MKRFLTLLFTALLLTAALCVSASASDFDSAAEDLSAIGLFRGTDKGFDLDRAPTRSEAAIMLVRLYGAEDAAKAAYDAGEISHPFTDVSDFTSPYVAWLYTNGITNGFTATTYASQRPCTAQNYAAFLLRALGYQDGRDFAYADTLTFAQEKGFYEPALFTGAFLRDDLAALTYQALAADLADGSTYLLSSLISSGAVDAAAAQPMTEKIEAFRALQSAYAGMDPNAMDLGMKMRMNMVMDVDGESETMSTDITGSIQTIVNGSDVQMAYDMTSAVLGTDMRMQMWMKDGWMYQAITAAGETMKVKTPLTDELAALETVNTVDPTAMDVSSLALIDSITTKTTGGNTEYTLVLGRGMDAILDGVTGLTGTDAADLSIDSMTLTYVLDRTGTLKAMRMVFDADMTMIFREEDGTFASIDVRYDYSIDLDVKATGKSVKLTYPDFSDFTEISQEELAGL